MKASLKFCLILLICGFMGSCSDDLYVDVDPVPSTTIYLSGGYRYYHPLPAPRYHYYYWHNHLVRPLPPIRVNPPMNPGRPGGHGPGGMNPGRPGGHGPGMNPGGRRPGDGGRPGGNPPRPSGRR